MTGTTTPESLLGTARELCADPPVALEGRWPRAVALLTRQALELALDEYWDERAPGIGKCRAQRPKMLCLHEYLPDHALSRDAHQTWVALSGACHQHAYVLDPTVAELLGWIARVEDIRAALLERSEDRRLGLAGVAHDQGGDHAEAD